VTFWVDDLDVFFQDFVVDAIYTPQGGVASTIKVIYDREYIAVDTAGNVLMESRSPIAHCKNSDIPNVKHGDTLMIDGMTFYVTEIQPDGTGITRLILSETL